MTRANINFIWQKWGESPRTLFHYWNGGQYPQGLRDHYNLLDFVEGEWTPESFSRWIERNYDGQKPEDLGEGGQPKVYYTHGFITDYTYVFQVSAIVADENGKEVGKGRKVIVWRWADKIFQGDDKEFARWLKKKKKWH